MIDLQQVDIQARPAGRMVAAVLANDRLHIADREYYYLAEVAIVASFACGHYKRENLTDVH